MNNFQFTSNHANFLLFAIPISLTLTGFAHNEPSAYFDALKDFSLFLLPGMLLVQLVSTILFQTIGTKIQAYKTAPPKYGVEIFHSSISMYVFATIAAWPLSFYRLGYPTSIRFSLAESQPYFPDSYFIYGLKVFILTLFTDFYMYWKHRILHGHTFQVFHSHGVHHGFHDPSPFAAFAIHPFEALVTYWPTAFIMFPYAGIWVQAQIAWVVAFVLLNMYLHAGYEISILESTLPYLFINTSSFHNLHHEKKYANFGELLYLWDYLCRTGFHPHGYNTVENFGVAKDIVLAMTKEANSGRKKENSSVNTQKEE